MLSTLMSILLTTTWATLPAQVQEEKPQRDRQRAGDRADRGDRSERRERREGRRGGREGRDGGDGWQRYRNATPEERQKMRTDRMIEMAARTYDLTDEQKTVVRTEMDKMREERRAQMGPMADRYDQLREQMMEYWTSRRDENGDGDRRSLRSDPEFQKLRSEMQEIERKFPFDWQASVQRIESLLPPEQAAKGRARFEERRQRWQERREDRESRLQERMLDTISESEKAAAEGRAADAVKALKKAERELDRRGLSDAVRQELSNRIQLALQQIEPAASVESNNATPAAEHAWEKFVREFGDRYALSATQQSSAAAILKDVRSRASQIEISNAAKIVAATELTDAKERDAKLKELNAPIEKLFDELKIRLDGLLTAEQRARGAKA